MITDEDFGEFNATQIEHLIVEIAHRVIDQMTLSTIKDELVERMIWEYEATPDLVLDDIRLLNLSHDEIRRIAKGASK